MKRLLIAAIAASALALSVAPATAAPWMPINERQAQLDARIDQGVRDGSLTRREAGTLRAEFRDIADLEARYRRSGGGLSDWERRDLDRRMDALSARIRVNRHDAQERGGWVSINQRQAQLDARIDQGVRSGQLTRREADSLRAEFRDIASLEAQYRRSRGGLSNWERDDLDRRMDALSARIARNKHDRDRRY